ncbi:Uma2 family endonuclease [Streptomyces sp. NA02950]|uniref:Uma2 family endonuclease n=1 Tax=Streptomyces sp. NA02950 TaxID=2742137 RepID=UPI00159062AF|nr:Uma2 family endonuclease [Streptomyces sp. NA02950]QKV95024.1 Uma2 family endonuclease [Streptomyces sp. NA02950]
MTAVDDRVELMADDRADHMAKAFEDLSVPEGLKAELIRGEIVMMAGPDWVNNSIVESVVDQIPRAAWHRLQTQDIAIPGEASEPQPDLVVYERGGFEGPGRLVPAPAVTMVVEVISKTSARRDYQDKRSVYAAGQIPAYLIIDPIAAKCVLLTEPKGAGEEADYWTERASEFGDPVTIEALDLTLETDEFHTLS